MSNFSNIPDIYSHTHSNLENNISRRTFLRYGSATVIGASIAPLTLWVPKADAAVPAWLAWTGKRAAVAAIGWIVDELLDRFVAPHLDNLFDLFNDRQHENFKTNRRVADRLAEKLEIKKGNRKPTNNAFHNQYASPYAVTNKDYYFDSAHSRKCCAFIKLNHYLRFSRMNHIPDFNDTSIDEIQYIAQIAHKEKKILIPYGNRYSYSVRYNGIQYKYRRWVTDGRKRYLLYAYKSNIRQLWFQHYLV